MKFSKVTIPEGWNPEDPDGFNAWIEKISGDGEITKWEGIQRILEADTDGDDHTLARKLFAIEDIFYSDGNKYCQEKLLEKIKDLEQ